MLCHARPRFCSSTSASENFPGETKAGGPPLCDIERDDLSAGAQIYPKLMLLAVVNLGGAARDAETRGESRALDRHDQRAEFRTLKGSRIRSQRQGCDLRTRLPAGAVLLCRGAGFIELWRESGDLL